MNTVQTKESTTRAPATMANGLQLVSLICAGINTLKLTQEQVSRWTNNMTRLRAWLKLLLTDWMPTEMVVVESEDRSPAICTLSDAGYMSCGVRCRQTLASIQPWIDDSDGRSVDEMIERFRLPEGDGELKLANSDTSVYRCSVIGEPDWYIDLFRRVFAFKGNDDILVRAFVRRNVVWDIQEVLSLVAGIIHNPQDDPLQIQEMQGTIFSPCTLAL